MVANNSNLEYRMKEGVYKSPPLLPTQDLCAQEWALSLYWGMNQRPKYLSFEYDVMSLIPSATLWAKLVLEALLLVLPVLSCLFPRATSYFLPDYSQTCVFKATAVYSCWSVLKLKHLSTEIVVCTQTPQWKENDSWWAQVQPPK